eukprot:scaffold7597_cov51-Phaeocystis_antarctica.AAC.2
MGPNVFARDASACEGREAISASTFSSCVTVSSLCPASLFSSASVLRTALSKEEAERACRLLRASKRDREGVSRRPCNRACSAKPSSSSGRYQRQSRAALFSSVKSTLATADGLT